MKLREIIRKVREGPTMSDKPRPPLRGLSFPQNDVRLGLPTPAPRKDVTWTRPQPTTSSDSGISLSPQTPNWSKPGQVKIPQAPVGKYAATGQSPTSTGGFRGNTPSGTGLTKQVPRYVPSARPGDSDKRRAGRGIPRQ
jgi:hypothetical protein